MQRFSAGVKGRCRGLEFSLQSLVSGSEFGVQAFGFGVGFEEEVESCGEG